MEFYLIFTLFSIAFLEVLLSIDNAVVIGLMAREAGPQKRKKVMFYGLLGAFLLRGVMLFIVSWLTRVFWLKLAGGLYLVGIAIVHFYEEKELQEAKQGAFQSFRKVLWKIIFIDLIFAVDSVLAVVALAKEMWVIIGGVLVGMIAIRFIAGAISTLLDRFPYLETAGYAIVGIVGIRMSIDALNEQFHFAPAINFHSPDNISFWIFWIIFVGLCILPFIAGKSRKS